jgi:hypothetical protein
MKKMNQNEIIKFLTEANAVEKNSSQMELLQMLNEAPAQQAAPKLSLLQRGAELARKALPDTMKVLDKGKDVIDTVRGIPQSERTRIGQYHGQQQQQQQQPAAPSNAPQSPSQGELGVMIGSLQRNNFRIAPNTSAHYAGKTQTGIPLYAFQTIDNTNKTVIKVLQTDGTIVQ